MRACLIAYDICDSSVRAKAALRLSKVGRRVQKSVYIVEMGEAALKHLEWELQGIIRETDSLLVLPLSEANLEKARFHGQLPTLMLMG